nr:PREDICTED: uroplakin-1a [Equus przewalskii]
MWMDLKIVVLSEERGAIGENVGLAEGGWEARAPALARPGRRALQTSLHSVPTDTRESGLTISVLAGGQRETSGGALILPTPPPPPPRQPGNWRTWTPCPLPWRLTQEWAWAYIGSHCGKGLPEKLLAEKDYGFSEEAEKGSPVVVGLLVVGNIVILLSGLALFAETVWVTADQYRVYPLMGVSGKDDVFAGAWIAIFCGFSFFVVASFGVGAALCHRRSMMLTYLVLMLIVYIFECASCITAYTHRDYMVSNPSLITKQMLTFYSADTAQGRELTRLWDRIMTEQECCGTSGPMDWVNFTSAFRAATPEVTFPWPPLCCRRTGNFIPLSEEGCRLGHMDYLFTKGCFEHISHAIDSYTWGISWFGFAILMWTLPVMLIAMYFYTTL